MASGDDSGGTSGEEGEEEEEKDSLSTISLPNFLSVKRKKKSSFTDNL